MGEHYMLTLSEKSAEKTLEGAHITTKRSYLMKLRLINNRNISFSLFNIYRTEN